MLMSSFFTMFAATDGRGFRGFFSGVLLPLPLLPLPLRWCCCCSIWFFIREHKFLNFWSPFFGKKPGASAPFFFFFWRASRGAG